MIPTTLYQGSARAEPPGAASTKWGDGLRSEAKTRLPESSVALPMNLGPPPNFGALRDLLRIPAVPIPAFAAVRDRIPDGVAAAVDANSSGEIWSNQTLADAYGSSLPFLGSGTSLAYDPVDRYVVRVGGGEPPYYAPPATWSFDGANWTNLSSAGGPPSRVWASATWDYADDYLVLFGGLGPGPNSSSVTLLGDTWTFRAGTWTQLSASDGPSPRYGAAMSFDPGAGAVVLFGGLNGSGTLADTWEFKGGSWSALTTSTAPTARALGGIAYDAPSSQMILFGGATLLSNRSFAALNDTWGFTAGAWTHLSTTRAPPPVYGFAMTNDSADSDVVLSGGGSSLYANGLAITWTWGSGGWNNATAPGDPQLAYAGATYDPVHGRVVLEGGGGATGSQPFGFGETWFFGAGRWTHYSSIGLVTPEVGPGFATDPTVGGGLLFGGENVSGFPLNTTWEYRRGLWQELFPLVSPAARGGEAIAWDSAMNGVVLFGGATTTSVLNDTWLFKGGSWTNLTSGPAPSPRADAGVAYDPSLARLVVFGGSNLTGVLGDTWALSAAGHWTLVSTSGPSPRDTVGMAYDGTLHRIVLFGGSNYSYPSNPSGVEFSDTWTFANSTWSSVLTSVHPAARQGSSLVYDPAVGVDVLFGGGGASAVYPDTWEYSTSGWRNVTTSPNPGPLVLVPMIFDPGSGTVLAFGGILPVPAKLEILVNSFEWLFDPIVLSATSSTGRATAPAAVVYSSASHGGNSPLRYNWTFGDGSYSSSPNATHVFYRPGTFNATLDLRDALGATLSVVLPITLNGTGVTPLTTTLDASPLNGTPPLAVTFTGSSSGGVSPYTCSWQFGDGAELPNCNTTVSHSYGASGNFTAWFNVTDSLGGSVEKEVVIRVGLPVIGPLILSASATPAQGSTPLVVAFHANATGGMPPYSFNWTFGDGESATGVDATHTYSTAGAFTVTVVLTDSAQTRRSQTLSITVRLSGNGGAPIGGSLGASEPAVPWWLVAAVVVGLLAGVVGLVIARNRNRNTPQPTDPDPAATEDTEPEWRGEAAEDPPVQ